jgi:hypothetical protein
MVVKRKSGQWFDFEATGTDQSAEVYHAWSMRFAPVPQVINLSGKVPVTEMDDFSKRFRAFRDSISIA